MNDEAQVEENLRIAADAGAGSLTAAEDGAGRQRWAGSTAR